MNVVLNKASERIRNEQCELEILWITIQASIGLFVLADRSTLNCHRCPGAGGMLDHKSNRCWLRAKQTTKLDSNSLLRHRCMVGETVAGNTGANYNRGVNPLRNPAFLDAAPFKAVLQVTNVTKSWLINTRWITIII